MLSQEQIRLIFRLKRDLSSRRHRVVITTHQGPDGDAMGSSLALYQFLKKHGHDVQVISPNDYPEFLHWLPSNEHVINFMRQRALAEELVEKAEYLFQLDYNVLGRSADMTRFLYKCKAIRVLIDHHPNPDMASRFLFSNTEVSSTCELLYLILKH